MKTNTNIKT